MSLYVGSPGSLHLQRGALSNLQVAYLSGQTQLSLLTEMYLIDPPGEHLCEQKKARLHDYRVVLWRLLEGHLCQREKLGMCSWGLRAQSCMGIPKMHRIEPYKLWVNLSDVAGECR